MHEQKNTNDQGLRDRDIPDKPYPAQRIGLFDHSDPLQEKKLVDASSNSLQEDFADIPDVEAAKQIIEVDRERLENAIRTVKNTPTLDVLKQAFDNDAAISELGKQVTFDHEALLMITPPTLVTYWLQQNGFRNVIEFPSAIVKDRLKTRHGNIECPTRIIKAEIEIEDPDGSDKKVIRKIEIFLPAPEEKAWNKKIIEDELKNNHESHTSLVVHKNTDIAELRTTFISLGLVPDGSGTNDKEGSTTLYFKNSTTGQRFELISYQKADKELAEKHNMDTLQVIGKTVSPEE